MEDLGGTYINLSQEGIRGESRVLRSGTMHELLASTLEQLGCSKEESFELASKHIRNEEDEDPEDAPYGIAKVSIDVPVLSTVLGQDEAATNQKLKEAVDHYYFNRVKYPTELTLVEDSGNTKLKLGWETIKGESSAPDSKLHKMLARVFELLNVEQSRAASLASEYIKKREVEGSDELEDIVDIDLNALCDIVHAGGVSSRGALGKVVSHFLMQSDKYRDRATLLKQEKDSSIKSRN